jgi:hypothetical protein
MIFVKELKGPEVNTAYYFRAGANKKYSVLLQASPDCSKLPCSAESRFHARSAPVAA